MEKYEKQTGKYVFRIFISSTFADMHAERDYLREHAFRRLSAELSKEGYGFLPVDLRGSVEEDYADAERNVFHMCLRRVDDCRPRFLGLVGERYGWICYDDQVERGTGPEDIRLRRVIDDVCDETGLKKDEIRGRSMTHIEMLYGMKNMSKEQCFYYIREPLPLEKMSADRALYSENPAMQDDLKRWIRQEMSEYPQHVREYPTVWQADGTPLSGLEALDKMVYEDLRASFLAEIAEREKKEEDPQKTYEDLLLSGSLKRTELIEKIEHAAYTFRANPTVLVTASDGSGKSTLLAQLDDRLRQGDAFVLTYFTGVNEEFSDILNLYRRFVPELIAAGAEPLPRLTITDDENKWREMFRERLAQIAGRRRVIVLVDSVDQLITELANPMMLIGDIPQNVILIATADEGFRQPAAFGSLAPTLVIDNSLLSDDELEEMIAADTEEFGKTLDAGIREMLIKKTREANSSPLFLKLLIDYICHMTGADYRAYRGADAHREWMSAAIREMPPSAEGAFSKVLERARESYGAGQVMCLVSLIACTKGGIRTAELRAAMDGMGIPLDEVTMYEIRDALSAYLRRDIDLDWWKFEYPALGEAIISSYNTEQLRALHSVIVQAAEDLDVRDIFKAREFIYHCFMANDQRSAELYVSDFKFSIQDACRQDLRQLHEIINSEEGMAFVLGLLGAFRTPSYPAFFLNTVLKEVSSQKGVYTLDQRKQIAAKIAEAFLTRGHMRNAPVSGARYCQEQEAYCNALLIEGRIRLQGGENEAAMEYFRKAEKELELLMEEHPGENHADGILLAVRGHLKKTDSVVESLDEKMASGRKSPGLVHDAGVAHMDHAMERYRSDPSGAIEECTEAIGMIEESLTWDGHLIFLSDNYWDRDLALAHAARAKIYLSMEPGAGGGAREKAAGDYSKAISIMKESLAKKPNDAERVKMLLMLILESDSLSSDIMGLYEDGAAAFAALDDRAARNTDLYNPFAMMSSRAAQLCAKLRMPNGIITWMSRNEEVLKRCFPEDRKTPVTPAYLNIYRSLESAYKYLGDAEKAAEYHRKVEMAQRLLGQP